MPSEAIEDTQLEDSQGADNSGWYSNEAATFGDRLAAAREALGLSQADLARRIGIKIKTLQGWEDDLSEPRANKLSMLAGILNVSMIWLLNGEGPGLSEPTDYTLPEEVSALLTELRQLKGTLARTAEQIGGLEKRMQKALRAGQG
ncbi:MAG: helix-turn-helix domain-containing protein [Pseudomonadota bacterium]